MEKKRNLSLIERQYVTPRWVHLWDELEKRRNLLLEPQETSVFRLRAEEEEPEKEMEKSHQ